MAFLLTHAQIFIPQHVSTHSMSNLWIIGFQGMLFVSDLYISLIGTMICKFCKFLSICAAWPVIPCAASWKACFSVYLVMEMTAKYCLCCAADPFLNDQNFVLSVLSLEELGATGNKGLAGLTGNPVLANGIAGLATSATAQATVQRMLLWQMRNYTVEPFNETVQQVFARVSALRDSLDGPQVKSQLKWHSDVPTDVTLYVVISLVLHSQVCGTSLILWCRQQSTCVDRATSGETSSMHHRSISVALRL